LEGVFPGRQIDGKRLPGDPSVDLVVLVDDEVAVGDSERPVDTFGGEDTELCESVGRLPSFIISESPASWRRSSAR
jgi:hypothetical protein